MNEQKSKFKWSYLVVLLLIVLIFVLIFTNNGYKGEKITGGVSEVEELIEGRTNPDKENKYEKIVSVYYNDTTMYFLLQDSQYTDHFPDYADYYINYRYNDGTLNAIREAIEEYNSSVSTTEENKIKLIPAVDGVNAWDIIYPILYIAFGLFLVWMIFKLLNSSGKGAMSFGKSRAKAYTTSKVKFSDIAGTDEEKKN